MKIVDLRITSVNVPFEATLRWACGVETGTTRGIIEVVTEDGIIGLGEIYGGSCIEHASKRHDLSSSASTRSTSAR